MGNQAECNLKHRIIPKLTPADNKEADKDTADTDPAIDKKKETVEERIARINAVNLTLGDFFFKVGIDYYYLISNYYIFCIKIYLKYSIFQCLDHQMLKLFFLCMLAFFFTVGVITSIYLTVIYFFKQSLWYFYFPTEAHLKGLHKEL